MSGLSWLRASRDICMALPVQNLGQLDPEAQIKFALLLTAQSQTVWAGERASH